MCPNGAVIVPERASDIVTNTLEDDMQVGAGGTDTSGWDPADRIGMALSHSHGNRLQSPSLSATQFGSELPFSPAPDSDTPSELNETQWYDEATLVTYSKEQLVSIVLQVQVRQWFGFFLGT